MEIKIERSETPKASIHPGPSNMYRYVRSKRKHAKAKSAKTKMNALRRMKKRHY
jgi:hypothetical protein